MHQNLFQKDENARLLIATLLKYRDAGEFELHDFVVMPNHLRAVLSVNDGKAIGRAVQLIKGGFSHALHLIGCARTVWQPGYHEHRVRDGQEYQRIRNYVAQNPVRQGLGTQAADYPYSSAGYRCGLDGVPEGLKPGKLGPVYMAASRPALPRRRLASNETLLTICIV
jgi:putative transposase